MDPVKVWKIQVTAYLAVIFILNVIMMIVIK